MEIRTSNPEIPVFFDQEQVSPAPCAGEKCAFLFQPFRQKIRGCRTIAARNQNGIDLFVIFGHGVAVTLGAEDLADIARFHGGKHVGTLAHDLVNDSQAALFRISAANTEGTAQNTVPEWKNADMHKLSRFRRFGNLRSMEHDPPVRPLQHFVAEDFTTIIHIFYLLIV